MKYLIIYGMLLTITFGASAYCNNSDRNRMWTPDNLPDERALIDKNMDMRFHLGLNPIFFDKDLGINNNSVEFVKFLYPIADHLHVTAMKCISNAVVVNNDSGQAEDMTYRSFQIGIDLEQAKDRLVKDWFWNASVSGGISKFTSKDILTSDRGLEMRIEAGINYIPASSFIARLGLFISHINTSFNFDSSEANINFGILIEFGVQLN